MSYNNRPGCPLKINKDYRNHLPYHGRNIGPYLLSIKGKLQEKGFSEIILVKER